MWCGLGRRRLCWGVCSRATPGAEEILEANGIDPDGDEILLRREIGANGKGRVFVNNQPATVAVSAAAGSGAGAGSHAQSETLVAFDATQQRTAAGQVWRRWQRGTMWRTVSFAYAKWRATVDAQIEELRIVWSRTGCG